MKMVGIQNEHIRGTAQVGCFGDKDREARLRWFGNVQRETVNTLVEGGSRWSYQAGGKEEIH